MSSTTLTTSSQPGQLFIADFDLDGYSDLAVTCAAAIDFFPGGPGGSLGPRVSSPLFAPGPGIYTSGDVNGDGREDLVVAYPYTSIVTYFGQPGGFAPGIATPLPGFAWGIALADFDGDGRSDLVLAQSLYSGGISIMAGRGDGTFAPEVVVPNTGPAESVTAGDFNGDGRIDIAYGMLPHDAVLLLNQPGGAFTASGDISTAGEPYRIEAGDLNSDGALDLAVATPFACGHVDCIEVDQITVAMGDGQGGLGGATYYLAGGGTLASGRVDADPYLDLLSCDPTTNSVFFLQGQQGGWFAPREVYCAGNAPGAIAIGDLSGDGRPDVVVSNTGASSVTLFVQTDPPLAAPAAGPGGALRIRLDPNPARSAVTLRLETIPAGRVDVRVLDLQGRLRRTLLSGETVTGGRELRWDLRDAFGARVAPGVYLVRIRVSGIESSRRVIVTGG